MTRAGWLAATALLLALALGPSWPWRGNPFMRDDESIVVTNPAVRSPRPWTEYFTDPETYSRIRWFNEVCYRPLTPLTLAWDAGRAGLDPASFRVTNLALHGLAALLVLLFVRALLGELHPTEPERTRDGVAIGVALLFAVHPLSAFAVQYISNRGFLWMVVGYYAALYAYVRAWTSSRPVLAGAVVVLCFAVALCGKEPAVTLVATAFLLEVARDPSRAGGPRGWARVGGLVAVVVAYFGVRWAVGLGMSQSNARPDAAGLLAYVLGQLRVQLVEYLPAFVWPGPIRWEPTPPPGSLGDPWAWGAAGACLVLVALAIRARRTHPVLALGVLAYPVTMIPTMLLAQPIPVSFYRTYPGSPFLYLALLWALRGLAARRPRAGAAVAVLVLALLAGASYRVGWRQRDLGEVWLHSVRHGGAPRAHFLLAKRISDRATRVEAMTRVIQRAPHFDRSYSSRGVDLLLMGRSREALNDLQRALRLEPRVPENYLFLAVAARAAGQEQQAAEARQAMRSLGWRPSWSSALGFAEQAIQAERPRLARDALAFLESPPDGPWQLDFTRGVAAHQAGDLLGAVEAYREAGARGGDQVLLWRNLGMALRQLGRCPEAREALGRALALAPQDTAARANLELCGETR